MKFGIPLGQLHPAVWRDAAVAADELGFESIWLSEHLVLPVRMSGELVPGEEHPPIKPTTPVYDLGLLSYLAAVTARIKLGTFVYLLALRHPFVGARAFATLDVLSGGRALCGVGAGWMRSEWEAVGLDFASRGRRLDEAIAVCRLLWTSPTVAFEGEFYSFPEVAFEPKPVQSPLPVIVGGESQAALRRAASLGDGWIGMEHTPASARDQVSRLRDLGFDGEVTVMTRDVDVDGFAAAGVDRLMVVPWTRTSEALDGMKRFAASFIS